MKTVDDREPTAADYEDSPELGDDFFATATLNVAGRPLRRGRPKADKPKVSVTLRLSADVVERFRSAGPGWHGLIDAALADWLFAHPGVGDADGPEGGDGGTGSRPTRVRTGEACPASGIWRAEGTDVSLPVTHGTIMPPVRNRIVVWTFKTAA